MPSFKTYLVGGAVRDKLLQKPVNEFDWVVVGATPETMLELGYKPVGKDFPVFLHPQTHDEYALARSEKKVAPGYQGFVFHTSPDVTLEQDLLRRDLTINAIAEDETGNLTDPYNGINDLKQKTFKHVSNAFIEDPVRLLRLARFAAYLPEFSIHPDTLTLLKNMVSSGEIDALVPERVWAECAKSCSYNDIEPFFKTLAACDALQKIFPNLNISGLNFDAFRAIAANEADPILRWGALWHKTDPELSQKIMQHLKTPKAWRNHVELVQKNKEFYLNFIGLSAEDALKSILKSDAIRRPERLLNALNTLSYCLPGNPKPAIEPLLAKLKKVDVQPLLKQGLKGQELAEAISQVRLNIVKTFKDQ